MPEIGVWCASAVFVVLGTVVAFARHEHYFSGTDLAFFAQGAWLAGQGEWPFVTIRGRYLLGDHVSPGFLAFLPFGVAAGAKGLLFAQTLALGATAPVLYRLSRLTGAAPWSSVVAPLAFLASPLMFGAAFYDFHVETLAPLCLALAVLAVLKGKTGWAVAALIAALSLKEDLGLVVAAFGVVVALLGRRGLGVAVLTGGLGWYLLSVKLVLPSFGSAVEEDYLPRYGGSRGDTTGEIARYILEHPLGTLGDVFSSANIAILALLIAGGGIICILSRWVIVAIPTTMVNFLSDFDLQHQISVHYYVVPAGAVAVAGAVAAGRLESLPGGWRRIVASGLAVLVLGLAVAEVSAARYRGGFTDRLRPTAVGAKDRLIASIPPGASVAASTYLVSHLTSRREIYTLPEPFRRENGGAAWSDADLRSRARGVDYVVYDTLRPLNWAGRIPFPKYLARSGFVLRARAGGVVVFRRVH